MLEKLKFPLVYVLEALLFLAVVAGFLGAASFLAAVPIAEIELQGKSLPAHWDAAVVNHGRYLQGHLISNQPVAFAFVVAVLLGSGYMLVLVQSARLTQRKEAGPSGRTAHNIAQACVFAIVGALMYFLVMHVLVGVNAA